MQESLNQKLEQERLFRKQVTKEMFGQVDYDDPAIYKMKQEEKEKMENMTHQERLEYKKRKVAEMMTNRAEQSEDDLIPTSEEEVGSATEDEETDFFSDLERDGSNDRKSMLAQRIIDQHEGQEP